MLKKRDQELKKRDQEMKQYITERKIDPRILYVGQDAEHQKVITDLCEFFGASVECAIDGSSALKKIDFTDVIITDLGESGDLKKILDAIQNKFPKPTVIASVDKKIEHSVFSFGEGEHKSSLGRADTTFQKPLSKENIYSIISWISITKKNQVASVLNE